MSEGETQNPKNPLRRVGKKDQKREIKATGPLFPTDETDDEEQVEVEDAPDEGEASTALADKPDAEPKQDFIVDPEAFAKAINQVNVPPLEDFPGIDDDKPAMFTPVRDRFPLIDMPREREEAPAFETDIESASAPNPSGRRKRFYGDWRHNLVALFFLIASIVMCGYYAHIYQNPWSSLNPFAPPTPFALVTVTPDPAQVAQFNLTQTALFAPTNTLQAGIPTVTPTPTLDVPPATATFASDIFPFVIANDVLYTPNSNSDGCNWASIAGIVVDINSTPLNNYGIVITDTENPEAQPERVFSGAALNIGEGGYELFLGGTPQQSRYDIQLFNPAGVPVSDVYTIITSSECEQNVAIINFQQTREF